MATGVVKAWDDGRGYGFITPDEQGADVFVHHSEIRTPGRRELKIGGRVRYEVFQGPKGPKARNVEAA